MFLLKKIIDVDYNDWKTYPKVFAASFVISVAVNLVSKFMGF